MATTVMLTTADGDMALYDAEPEGEARAAVIVFQEAFGVNPHIEDITRRLAAAGYRVVAPHLFHRTGDPVIEYGDFEKVMPQFAGLSEGGLLIDVDATIAYLAEAGFPIGRIGVVGFCMGGTVSFLVAASRPVGAAVTFYGAGVTEGRFGMKSMVDLAPQLQTPWLGLYGDEDRGIPVEQVEALRAALPQAALDTDWSGMPVPVTGSTATCVTITTRTPRLTPGTRRSAGSGTTCLRPELIRWLGKVSDGGLGVARTPL